MYALSFLKLDWLSYKSRWVILLALFLPETLIRAEIGLWTSKAELQTIPRSGPAWDSLLSGANRPQAFPDVSDQEEDTNVYVLASAIVYARTGDFAYRNKVIDAINGLVGRGYPGGRTLAWARETGAYALAADLVDYRTGDFETWLRNIAEVWIDVDGRTLLGMFKDRPNNWGSHAFGTLCAIYAYLQDNVRLTQVRNYWLQGVIGPNPGYNYGTDLSWHLNPADPHSINPTGAIKNGMDIDGVIPDDMRRGGSFQDPPAYTGYSWETLQGLIMAARILERVTMPIWTEGDSALYRAAYALQVRFAALYGSHWRAESDDTWMLPFFDKAYGTSWSAGQERLWEHGKNAGWGYVTLATIQSDPVSTAQYMLIANTFGSGKVTLDPPGGIYKKGTVVKLTARAADGWAFSGWRGDLTTSKNPETLLIDSNKNVTARFVQPITLQLTPTDDTYVQGDGYSNLNFNSQGYLRVKEASGEANDRHTYLRFDLSQLSGSVLSATLQLSLKALPNGGPAAATVYSATNDGWNESTLTWANAPAPYSALSSRNDIALPGAVYTFDVTRFVARQLGGDKTVTLVLKDGNQTAKAADFSPRESKIPPVLRIQVIR